MDLFMELLGTHLFLATVYLVILSYDYESSGHEKLRNAMVALFVPILGTLYASGLFRIGRSSKQANGNPLYDSALGVPAIGLVGSGGTPKDHYPPSVEGGCSDFGSGGGGDGGDCGGGD